MHYDNYLAHIGQHNTLIQTDIDTDNRPLSPIVVKYILSHKYHLVIVFYNLLAFI